MNRRATRERRRPGALRQLPWRRVRNPYPPLEPLPAEHLEAIVDGALEVLETVGMRVLEDECRRLLREAGASVDEATMMVRLDRALVLGKLALAPASFPLRARNPAKDLLIGGDHVVFGAVGGPAFVTDLDRGRRPGTYAEQCDYIRLVQSLDIIHQEGGGPFEAMDLPPESRHLDLYLAQLTLTDKNCQGVVLGRERTRDCIAMHAIALGADAAELARVPAVLGVVNTNSPLQLDIP
ncbi:MAG: trimethylamine methyltransferase family protein, partial [Gammaproteobacteria bacterium]